LVYKRVIMKNKAFTLIELLVVIAIIALLLSILMPALKKVKEQGRAVVCSSNQGQLGKAWFAYAGENNDLLIDGAPEWVIGVPDGYMSFSKGGGLVADGSGDETTASFVSIPQDINGNSHNTCLEDKIRGFKKGGLWQYYENYKLLNCPSDKRYRHPPAEPGTATATNTIGGYRSYSIGAVYSLIPIYYDYMLGTGEENEVVTKYSRINQPSSKVVWIEEADGHGFNGNTWNMYLNKEQWWDPFAIWHYGNSTFGYADGHADRYKWTCEVMIKMASEQIKDRPCPGSEDYQWFKKSYIPR